MSRSDTYAGRTLYPTDSIRADSLQEEVYRIPLPLKKRLSLRLNLWKEHLKSSPIGLSGQMKFRLAAHNQRQKFLDSANLEIPCENPKHLFKEARVIAQDMDRKNPPEGEVPINRTERTWAVTRIYWGHEMVLAACNDLLLSWVETEMEVLSC